MEVKRECPVCRSPITSHLRSIVFDSYIDKMLEHFNDDKKNDRKDLVIERKGKVYNILNIFSSWICIIQMQDCIQNLRKVSGRNLMDKMHSAVIILYLPLMITVNSLRYGMGL